MRRHACACLALSLLMGAGPSAAAPGAPNAAAPGLLAAAASRVPLAAQSPAPVQFRVTSRLVAVPVTVLNRHGQSVPGLRRKDFQLRVDGHRRPIVAMDGPGRGLPAMVALRNRWPSNLPRHGINNRPRSTMRKHVVLLFDALGIPATVLPRLRRQLTQSLAKLPVGVDVGIFRLGTGVQMVQPFSASGDRIAAVLQRMLSTPETLATSVGGVSEAVGNTVSVPGAQVLPVPQGGGPLNQALAATLRSFQQAQARMIGPARRADFYQRINTLRLLSQVLAGVPGHKEVLWFSTDPSDAVSGPPRRISYFLAYAEALFNAADASLYIINPSGLATFGLGAGVPSGGPQNSPLDAAALRASQTSLAAAEEVAENTGGSAMAQRNDIGHLARMALDRFGAQYTLYFAPHFPYKTRAQYHRIQIRVLRPGLTIRYRHGYRQRAKDLQGANLLAADLSVRQWATAPMDFRGLPLALIPGQRSGPMRPYWRGADPHRRIEELPFTLLIPLARLLHRTPHGGYLYDFSVVVMTTAAKTGKTSRLPTDDFRSHLSRFREIALQDTPLHYRGRFVLPVHGPALARVVVRDDVNGALGSVTLVIP